MLSNMMKDELVHGLTEIFRKIFDIIWKEMYDMNVIEERKYADILEEQQSEVRKLVLDGLRQAKEGKTKDFNAVCDRLEKKYI